MKSFNEASWGVIGQNRQFSSPSPHFTCGFVLSLALYGSRLHCLKISKSHYRVQQTQQSVSGPIHFFPLSKCIIVLNIPMIMKLATRYLLWSRCLLHLRGHTCTGVFCLGFFVLFGFGWVFFLTEIQRRAILKLAFYRTFPLQCMLSPQQIQIQPLLMVPYID